MKPERIEFGLRQLTAWEREGKQGIRRRFEHPNWREALILVEVAMTLGEGLEHFPEIVLQGSQVTVSLPPEGVSHLSERDLEFARALDTAAAEEEEIDAIWEEGSPGDPA